MAMPLPFSRPALRLICDNATCPRTMAAMGVRIKNGKSPQTKLPMAIPLVCCGPTGIADVAADIGATAPGVLSAPHLGQKYEPSAWAVPHLGQNTLVHPPMSCGD